MVLKDFLNPALRGKVVKWCYLVMEDVCDEYKQEVINQVNIECNNLSWAAGMSKVFELIFLVGRWYSEQGFTIMF